MASVREKSKALCSQGVEKYGFDGLLLSSADRGWRGLQAELRSHGAGAIEWADTHPDTEICVDVRGNRSIVSRQGRDMHSRTVSSRGTIWLSSAGSQAGSVTLSDPVPAILHIYLPSCHFSAESLGLDHEVSAVPLSREDSFQDPLLAEMAYALVSELESETSAGRLLADTLASSLAARLLQRRFGGRSGHGSLDPKRKGLDRARLSRVLDYIAANPEGNLMLDNLASIACLSRFHFARAFKIAVGRSPHQYVSEQRLEHAKKLLLSDDRPLVDISLALNFSCQANFTRAFVQATGQTPSRYRRSINGNK